MIRLGEGLIGAEGMGSYEVKGWILMVPAALRLLLINAAISLIPSAVIDMMKNVPPAQIRCIFR